MTDEALEALALGDRDAALRSLVPGTEDADAWTVVVLQLRGELDAAEPVLERWRARHGDTPRRRALERRQLLLRADRDLPAHAARLAQVLSVPLEHAREAEHAEAAPHPSALPAALVDPERILRQALERDRGLSGVTAAGLPALLTHALDAGARHALLSRLERTLLPGLVEALAAELGVRTSKGFGGLPVHARLTLEELEELAERVPGLRTQREWVLARLRRLRPPAGVDLDLDLDARDAHLARLWAEVADLPPVFLEAKAHVLAHRLAADVRRDRVDREALGRFLALPRRAGWTDARWFETVQAEAAAAFRVDFAEVTGLTGAVDEDATVRFLLGRLFETDPAAVDAFAPAADRRWLEALLAEARLLAGDPDVDRWTAVLGASATTVLRDRVDLELLPSNPRVFGRDAPVGLDVALKNAWPLRIRVFRVNTAAHVAACGADVPIDLDLDGLCPGWEEVRAGDPGRPALSRTRERLALDVCDRPGTWIVELVGNGRASRALVHKGDLVASTVPTASGLALTVVGEDGTPRPSATVRFAGRELSAGPDGVVRLPFGTQGTAAVLLCDGDLVVPAQVTLPVETWALSLAVLVDRQSLVPGAEARLLLRIDLTVGGVPAPLARLEDPWVETTTTDRTGVPVRRRQPLPLEDGSDVEVAVAVPEHVSTVSVSVGGRVRVVTGQRHEDLRADAGVEVGTQHATSATEALYLGASSEGYHLHLLGKSGEPRAGREVRVSLAHRLSVAPLDVTLATDADGRVALGPLPGVVGLRAATPIGPEAVFSLLPVEPSPPTDWCVPEGEDVVVPVGVGPAGAALADEDWALVELRGGVPAHDRRAAVRARPGHLSLSGLPCGQHTLWVRGRPPVTLTVVRSAARPRVVHGRALRATTRPPAVATAAGFAGDALVIDVHGASPDTRVHVVASPFVAAPALSVDLDGPRPVGPRPVPFVPRPSAFVSGRDLGDEARYVLDRQRLPRRPGTLLERPSLLLNPWARRTTESSTPVPRPAQGFAGAPPPAPAPAQSRARMESAKVDAACVEPAYAVHDFLAEPPVAHFGLRPDAGGRVTLPAAALGRHPVVTVRVVDPTGTHVRTVVRAPAPLAVRDLRLPAALPGDRHFREDRALAVARLPVHVVPSRRTSRLAVLASLEPLYRAFCALTGSADLAAWDFLPRWGTLPLGQRLALWDEHACHELALFVALRDRELADGVLRPFVANKLEPGFVDDWLLRRDLTGWLRPARLATLDPFERALLARAVPAARESLVRGLADAVELLVPDRAADDRLVDALLAGSDDPESAEGEPPAEAPVLADEAEEDSLGEREEARRPRSPPKAKLAKAGAPGGGRAAIADAFGEEGPALYRTVDKTREWAEHQWRRERREDRSPDRLPMARLWRDFAAHRDGPFLSPHLADGATGFGAAVLALAVTDLPFAPHRVTVAPRGDDLEVEASGPVLLAVSALAATTDAPTGEVAVGQSTVRDDDRYEWDGAERREKQVGSELLTAVVYTTSVVVTNPTARTLRLRVLLQIPAGAVPVAGGIPTRTTACPLPPYGTSTVAVSFCFPAPGTFVQAGARVTRDDTVVAAAPARTFTVVRVPTLVDRASFGHVSQRGTLDEVLAWLRDRNLLRDDLRRLAWRMRDPDAFRRVTAALAERGTYVDTLWAYGLLHADRARVREWLSCQDALLDEVGPLACDLCSSDPVSRGREEHLEYAPLVNARAHALGATRTVPNQGLAETWRRWLTRVAHQPAPTAEDWLAAAHHLFTMDRPDDALAALDRVPRGAARTALQHDWLAAYAALARGDTAGARALATPHADHPVPRWKRRFQALIAFVDEVAGGPAAAAHEDDREARLAALADRTPALTVRLEDGALVLDHQHLPSAAVRWYPMDVELLFSRQPFLSGGGDRFTFVDPAAVVDVSLDPTARRTRVALPDASRRANGVVEIVAGPLRQVVTHFAHDLAVTVRAPFGQLEVRRASTRAPLPATYVKVFARQRGGAVVFYKDGYTDLRGRWDHATVSTDALERVERFALLVLHDDAGATVLEAEPPVR